MIGTFSEDLPASGCHRLRQVSKARLLPLSYRMLPRKKESAGRTLRSSSGPTPVVFNLAIGRPYPAYRLQAPLLLFHCLFYCFSRGGLGIGEKPTRGELVRSTHRAPSPYISSHDFSLKPFFMRYSKYRPGSGLWPFSPRCVSFVCVVRNRASTPEKAEHGLSKESKFPQRIVRRDGGPVQGWRPYTQPSR